MRKIFEFPVLHAGWETDERGWVVEDENRHRSILLTDHGAEVTANPAELRAKVAEYQAAIERTEHALLLAASQP